MTKKLICALLALTMIFCTACSQADSSVPAHEDSSSTAADLNEDSSVSDPDHTVSEKSTETTTESSSVQTSETTKATTTGYIQACADYKGNDKGYHKGYNESNS